MQYLVRFVLVLVATVISTFHRLAKSSQGIMDAVSALIVNPRTWTTLITRILLAIGATGLVTFRRARSILLQPHRCVNSATTLFRPWSQLFVNMSGQFRLRLGLFGLLAMVIAMSVMTASVFSFSSVMIPLGVAGVGACFFWQPLARLERSGSFPFSFSRGLALATGLMSILLFQLTEQHAAFADSGTTAHSSSDHAWVWWVFIALVALIVAIALLNNRSNRRTRL